MSKREVPMQKQKDDRHIMSEFRVRQSRQYLAIAVTLLLLLFVLLLYKRNDIFGSISRNAIVTVQILLVAAFVVFSAFNWRCPSCKKYLGADIHRWICKKCGVRLR